MKFTTEEALKFTKRSVNDLIVFLTIVEDKIVLYRCLRLFFLFFSIQSLVLATVNGVYYCHDNFEIMTQTTCEVIVAMQAGVKVVTGRLQRSSYQSIIEEMESVINGATSRERVILDKYVNKSATLRITLTFGFSAASMNIILGSLFLTQDLPTYAVYPFDVESHPLFEFIYFHHAFTGIQCAACSSTDCFVAVLLWLADARFEMFEMEIANILDEYDLKRYILKHYRILSYGEKVRDTVRVMTFFTVSFMTILMVFNGLLFLITDLKTVKSQFIGLDLVIVIQMLASTYPAANLLQKSTRIGFAVYNFNWIDKSQEIRQNVCILINTTQKPVTVSISGVVPAYSLAYYMSVG